MARTEGFAYAETLGKWPLGEIALGINHYMRNWVIIEPVFARTTGSPYHEHQTTKYDLGCKRCLIFFNTKGTSGLKNDLFWCSFLI